MTGARDAIVIGAGVNGLAAAAYLAMAGKRVLVLEARDSEGGLSDVDEFADGVRATRAAHALYALDPSVVRELKLARHGLKFAVRDMPLVGLRNDGKHLVLVRDPYTTARHIVAHSDSDANAWAEFRREWFALARIMRHLWWSANSRNGDDAVARAERVSRMGAGAWLDSWFESDALKATLGFDAHALSPLAAGSALILVWRAAQEMCGLQGAVAFPRGGLRALVDAVAAAACKAGVETRTEAPVADIQVDSEGAVAGVALASGEMIAAPLVLSSLSRRQTLSQPSVRRALGLGEAAQLDRRRSGAQMARVALALDAPPTISGSQVPLTGRFVVAERLDSLTAAHAAAMAGRLPQELTMEVVLPVAADPALAPQGRHLVSVLVGPVPAEIEGGWKAAKSLLAAKVVAQLSRHLPGLSRHLVGIEVLTPDEARHGFGADDAFGGAVDAARLLADWRERVRTPMPGLILCGAAADPVGAVSGRGGRMAACFAFERDARP